MKKLVVILAVLALGESIAFSQNQKVEKPDAPSILIEEDGKKYSLEVRELAVDVRIVGTLAITTLDMTFANSYPRVLEGELNFPLADGQTVSRYALEVNGKIREGVSVEKAQGRAAYENTVRQKIDPGLLEMTRGNSFKSRIYPIPANGTKRIIIAYEQYLGGSSEGLLYTLPLNFKSVIPKFTLEATVVSDEAPDARSSELKTPDFSKKGTGYATLVTRTNYSADEQFSFTVPTSGRRTTTLTQTIGGKTYFYINTFPVAETRPRSIPKKICILYDVSSSCEKRDSTSEDKLLDGLFATRDVQVEFVPFGIQAEQSEIFDIRNGDWSALRSRMHSEKYDGGTDYSTIDFAKYSADEFFVFSDGIADFGAKEFVLPSRPVSFVNSLQNADHAYMRYVASATAGNYYNLKSMSDEQVELALAQSARMFLSAEYSPTEIEETYPRIATLANGSFTICGILKSASAKIKLNFGFAGITESAETVDIRQAVNQSDLIRKIWAMKKLEHLQMRSEKNKQEIIDLGKSMTIVTPYTSLIVLDRVEDYVRYSIVPPEELRAEYDKMLAARRSFLAQDSVDHAKIVLRLFEMKKGWWSQKFHAKQCEFSVSPTDENGNPIINAVVFIRNMEEGVNHTESKSTNGEFSFGKIYNGRYLVSVSSYGYEWFNKEVDVSGTSKIVLDAKMRKHTVTINIKDNKGQAINNLDFAIVSASPQKPVFKGNGKYYVEVVSNSSFGIIINNPNYQPFSNNYSADNEKNNDYTVILEKLSKPDTLDQSRNQDPLQQDEPLPNPIRNDSLGNLLGKVLLPDGSDAVTASVVVLNSTKGARVRSGGNYNIVGIRPGSYTVEARLVGFKKVSKGVTIRAKESQTVNFQFVEEISANTPVTVVAEMVEPRQIMRDRVGYADSSASSELVATSREGTSFLGYTSGVFNEASGLPSGERPNESQININGMRSEEIHDEAAFSPEESQSVLEPSFDNSSIARRSDKKAKRQGSGAVIERNEELQRKANVALASEKIVEKYSHILDDANNSDFYGKYMELKPEYGTSPAYYIDASRMASERGMKQLALRILSNIAEMELENRHLLRVLGNRLLQIGYADKAVQTLTDVLKISEEEPQSYRDLAIALAENGDDQRAAEMLYSIAQKNWHGRFPEVELIALTEMNNIIAHAKSPVGIANFDTRLIENMPVGLRVVLNWDSDNTDIDLWVTDPAKEKCFYSHPLTKSGGRISRDFTGGYGPEEFMIRQPLSGKYTIEANYFGARQQNLHGATTVYLDIFTDYGTPNEKKRTITLRLKTNKQIIKVGEIEVN